MRRTFWEMPDNEIAQLLDRAIIVLDELHIRGAAAEDLVRILQFRRSVCKHKSELWHKTDRQLHAALKDLDACEARIAAQETIVQSLRNESSSRNPPFWTRHDLDRINRQR